MGGKDCTGRRVSKGGVATTGEVGTGNKAVRCGRSRTRGDGGAKD